MWWIWTSEPEVLGFQGSMQEATKDIWDFSLSEKNVHKLCFETYKQTDKGSGINDGECQVV